MFVHVDIVEILWTLTVFGEILGYVWNKSVQKGRV